MWNQGRPDLAEKYFEIAYKIWPRDSQMLAEWGNFYIGQRRYDKAIPLLEQAREMTPFVPRTHEFLAYAYLYAGRPQEALETALHANQMDGAHASINLPTIAGAYEKLGQYEEAADAWRRTLQLKAGDLWLNWAMLARAQARTGDREGALRSADVALSKTRNEPRSTEAVQKLKAAIAGTCYSGAAADCDPLIGWQVAVGTPAAGTRS
jgi:tetratricopeptide (TPR) repeat protein